MKFEEEITVEVACSLKQLNLQLKKFGFEEIEQYDIKDIYMLDKRHKQENTLALLDHCVLIRDIIEPDKEKKQIEYKYKEYSKNGEILKNVKVNCKIESIEDAKKLLEYMQYEELLRINDHLIVYANQVDEIAVQLVNDKYIYIEIEQACHRIDRVYNGIEEMKNVITKYAIPIKENNYYVKKAEIELRESKR